MFTRVNEFAYPRLNELADEMTAHADGALRVVNHEKDNDASFDAESGIFFKMEDERLGHDFGFYTQLGKIRPAEAFKRLLNEVVIPVGKVSINARDKGLENLKQQSEFLGDEKTEIQHSIMSLLNPTF